MRLSSALVKVKQTSQTKNMRKLIFWLKRSNNKVEFHVSSNECSTKARNMFQWRRNYHNRHHISKTSFHFSALCVRQNLNDAETKPRMKIGVLFSFRWILQILSLTSTRVQLYRMVWNVKWWNAIEFELCLIETFNLRIWTTHWIFLIWKYLKIDTCVWIGTRNKQFSVFSSQKTLVYGRVSSKWPFYDSKLRKKIGIFLAWAFLGNLAKWN